MQFTLDLNQRWVEGRASYRRPDEPILFDDKLVCS